MRDDYDPTEELVLMARAGMDFRHILASMTTAPASRFGQAARKGELRPGMDADVVVLAGDPAKDIRLLARVVYTVRSGRIIFEANDALPDAPARPPDSAGRSPGEGFVCAGRQGMAVTDSR